MPSGDGDRDEQTVTFLCVYFLKGASSWNHDNILHTFQISIYQKINQSVEEIHNRVQIFKNKPNWITNKIHKHRTGWKRK